MPAATLAAPTRTPTPTAARGAVLTERYRPRTLAEIRGQGPVVFHLQEFVAAPSSASFLFEGATGVGKSSAARALAADLGCAVDEGAVGGYYVLPSGEQTAEAVRELIPTLWTRPMMGSGWKLVVVEEADRMSEAVAYLWLSILEDLPPRCVVVFTSNRAGKFQRRFLDRSERFTFAADGRELMQDAQELVNSIWLAETGSMDDAPDAGDLPGLIDADGSISFRRAVRGLEPKLRARRSGRPAPGAPAVVPMAPSPAADPDPDPPAPAPRAPAIPRARATDLRGLRAEYDALDDRLIAIGAEANAIEDRMRQIKARLKTLKSR